MLFESSKMISKELIMITLEEAILAYENKYPDYAIGGILDVGDEWVISAKLKATGEELTISPTAISKDDCSMRVFFPPMNMDKLENATIVEIK